MHNRLNQKIFTRPVSVSLPRAPHTVGGHRRLLLGFTLIACHGLLHARQRGYRHPTGTSDCQTRFRLLKRNKIAGDVRTAWGETSLSVPECGHAVTGHIKIEFELCFKSIPFLGLFWHLNHYRRPVRTPNHGYQSDQNSSRELVEVWACGRRNAVAAFPCRAR